MIARARRQGNDSSAGCCEGAELVRDLVVRAHCLR